jgi:hypothetical protein
MLILDFVWQRWMLFDVRSWERRCEVRESGKARVLHDSKRCIGSKQVCLDKRVMQIVRLWKMGLVLVLLKASIKTPRIVVCVSGKSPRVGTRRRVESIRVWKNVHRR